MFVSNDTLRMCVCQYVCEQRHIAYVCVCVGGSVCVLATTHSVCVCQHV